MSERSSLRGCRLCWKHAPWSPLRNLQGSVDLNRRQTPVHQFRPPRLANYFPVEGNHFSEQQKEKFENFQTLLRPVNRWLTKKYRYSAVQNDSCELGIRKISKEKKEKNAKGERQGIETGPM